VTAGYELHEELPALVRPVLVVMMTGWIDASGAAAAALDAVNVGCDTRRLATFDGEAFIDYRARRPTMELRDGINTRLVWPETVLRVGRDRGGRDVLTLSGPEPDSQWRRFGSLVAELAEQLGVSKMVALGAYPFAAPHTRVARLSCSTPSMAISATLPYLKNSVDVPAGASAVLEHALDEVGIAALGLWVQVPHYVSAMEYPAGTLALLSGLRDVAGVEIDTTSIATDTAEQRIKLDGLVAGNDEHEAMLRQLEAVYDASAQQTLSLGQPSVPTGDELAAEFERFLRDQEP
jgi:hypothetical protein